MIDTIAVGIEIVIEEEDIADQYLAVLSNKYLCIFIYFLKVREKDMKRNIEIGRSLHIERDPPIEIIKVASMKVSTLKTIKKRLPKNQDLEAKK